MGYIKELLDELGDEEIEKGYSKLEKIAAGILENLVDVEIVGNFMEGFYYKNPSVRIPINNKEKDPVLLNAVIKKFPLGLNFETGIENNYYIVKVKGTYTRKGYDQIKKVLEDIYNIGIKTVNLEYKIL